MQNFVVSRLGASFFPISYKFQWSPVRQSAFLFLTSFKSKQNPLGDDNFTISYLVTSCGLSPEAAARVSQNLKLRNKTPDKANAVLNLLKNYGFSESQISECVQQQPWLLLSDAEKTLLPKLKFLHSIGLPIPQFPSIIAHNRILLKRSLNNFLIPRYNVLKSVLHSEEQVVRALKRGAFSFLQGNVTHNLLPNVDVLRHSGVPHPCISYLVSFHPASAFTKHSKFVEIVKLVQEMKLDPLKTSFVSAIHVLVNVGTAKWESRLKAYNNWGWSNEISISVFRKFPILMSFTEERIMKSMNFLVNDMGWASEHIARVPQVLAYSFHKRIIPRCTVIKILKSKGLVKNSLNLYSFLSLTEEVFLKRIVTKFLEDVPLLAGVYQGSVDHGDVL
ncbi:hypothetical protein VNO77_29897 [Canavalia gladiata]|uniref:Uncharacterized protein n=1 Tax=Canavalia gladiata TaxID=3824 RepID=A0AAN9Q3B0_CANGL